MQPKPHGRLSPHFSSIIAWVFEEPRDIDIVLGGGCALSEFFFGHRLVTDIDFFVNAKAQIQEFGKLLSTAFLIKQCFEEKSASFKYMVQVENQIVPVHCVFFRQWKDPLVRDRFTTHWGLVRLHTLDFIGAWKLSYYVDRQTELLKNLVDLYFISAAGITADQLISAVCKLGIRPCPWPYELPKRLNGLTLARITPHISIEELEDFACRFVREIRKAGKGRVI
ncbi:TPA: hypothetical protein EYP66_21415 [Candidatus Poribacteria bacterium]|nr:hypothetical protein [Candidatus Poribacteria bacterium]